MRTDFDHVDHTTQRESVYVVERECVWQRERVCVCVVESERECVVESVCGRESVVAEKVL